MGEDGLSQPTEATDWQVYKNGIFAIYIEDTRVLMLIRNLLLTWIYISFWSRYLKMRYEVGRDTPLRLDSGATSLAVGLDFAIFPFKHNIKVIQNRHLRNWRHRSEQFLCSEVKSTCDQGRSESEVSISPRLLSWAQASVFTSRSPITHSKTLMPHARTKDNWIPRGSCVALRVRNRLQ